MSKKKQYKKQLPAALPPKPRREPEPEAVVPSATPFLPIQAPEPELEQVRELIRQLVSDLDDEPGPAAAAPASPVRRPAPAAPAPAPAASVRRPAPLAAPVPTSPPPPARPAPAAPPVERERERASGLKVAGLVLVALVSAALGGGAVAWLLRGDEAPPVETPAAQVPPGWPEAGASRTLTKVRADGVLEVTHWIHTDEPLDQVDVSLPDVGEGTAVAATDVRVTADGEPASGPGEITFSRATYVFDAATLIQVTYELDGAVERSTSAAGRGLATTTALDVSATQPRDVRVIRSAAVLSLSCAATMAAELAPCGTSESDGEWKVQLTGPDAGGRVVAAVTVPS